MILWKEMFQPTSLPTELSFLQAVKIYAIRLSKVLLISGINLVVFALVILTFQIGQWATVLLLLSIVSSTSFLLFRHRKHKTENNPISNRTVLTNIDRPFIRMARARFQVDRDQGRSIIVALPNSSISTTEQERSVLLSRRVAKGIVAYSISDKFELTVEGLPESALSSKVDSRIALALVQSTIPTSGAVSAGILGNIRTATVKVGYEYYKIKYSLVVMRTITAVEIFNDALKWIEFQKENNVIDPVLADETIAYLREQFRNELKS